MKTLETLSVEQAFIECECDECQRIETMLGIVLDFVKCKAAGVEMMDVGAVEFYATLLSYASEVAQFLADAHMVEIAAKLGVLEQFMIDIEAEREERELAREEQDKPF